MMPSAAGGGTVVVAVSNARIVPVRADSCRQADEPLIPDADEIARFVRGIFKYATAGGVVSLRGFEDTSSNTVFAIRPVTINGNLDPVIEKAIALASKAAQAPKPVVFCPPLATFTSTDSASGTPRR